MPVLSLRDVTKTYLLGETLVQALRGVDLEIEKGEVLAIMGPSGSGKSTLMHILGLLDTPTSGEAAIEGTGVSTLTERKRAGLRGKRIGFVFQTFNLVETLTAQGNVELPMIFQGVKPDVRAKRAADILTKVGLHDRIRHRPSQLSGGERQRVAIARALANDPEIILADEPTGNLDSESGQLILELLADLARRDAKTVILVTHNPDAAAIADRVVTLKDGRITHERRNA
jgi:putative ABC transport system ATP-binding protein